MDKNGQAISSCYVPVSPFFFLLFQSFLLWAPHSFHLPLLLAWFLVVFAHTVALSDLPDCQTLIYWVLYTATLSSPGMLCSSSWPPGTFPDCTFRPGLLHWCCALASQPSFMFLCGPGFTLNLFIVFFCSQTETNSAELGSAFSPHYPEWCWKTVKMLTVKRNSYTSLFETRCLFLFLFLSFAFLPFCFSCSRDKQ